MKRATFCSVMLAACTAAGAAGLNEVSISSPQLELVADFGWEHQPTGIAVSSSGRTFVSFPRWFTNFTGPSVAEVKDGLLFPYPNNDLNSWTAGEVTLNALLSIEEGERGLSVMYISQLTRYNKYEPCVPKGVVAKFCVCNASAIL